MCFSATASFGISAALTVGGVVALKKVTDRSQYFFAAIPLLFAIQQFLEGFVWLSLRDLAHENWTYPFAFAFLFFAQILWPAWVPVSVLMMEKDPVRRKILKILSVLGGVLSVYLAYCLMAYDLIVDISGFHVSYKWTTLNTGFAYSGIFYFIATVLPSFASRLWGMRMLGLLIAGSFIIAALFFGEYIISVWCYFAAVISLLVIFIVARVGKPLLNAVVQKLHPVN